MRLWDHLLWTGAGQPPKHELSSGQKKIQGDSGLMHLSHIPKQWNVCPKCLNVGEDDPMQLLLKGPAEIDPRPRQPNFTNKCKHMQKPSDNHKTIG